MNKKYSLATVLAISCAAICLVLCVLLSTALYSAQRNVHEERVMQELEDNLSKVTTFLLGYFYVQGNWVHLELQQQNINKAPNTLYSYIVSETGRIDLGINGLNSADIGHLKQTWEPDIRYEPHKPIRVRFIANNTLAESFPGRVKAGDQLAVLAAPILCAATQDTCGQLRIAVNFETVQPVLLGLRRILLLYVLSLSALIPLVVLWLTRRGLKPLLVLTNELNKISSTPKQIAVPDRIIPRPSKCIEIDAINQSISTYISFREEAAHTELELASAQSVADIAKQVAHDIRSPLTALKVIAIDSESIPLDIKSVILTAIERITGICNDLLSRSSQAVTGTAQDVIDINNIASPEASFADCIDALIKEKHIKICGTKSIDIVFNNELGESHGLRISSMPMIIRIISNLLDNAIDSIEHTGRICLNLAHSLGVLVIIIEDNGCGIPAEVLARVGIKGFTHGKKNGSGLGVFDAKEKITRIGGDLSLTSKPGLGTKACLTIPT